MLRKIRKNFVYRINQNPVLKKRLLWMYDKFFEYRSIVIGAFIRFPAYLYHTFNSKIIVQPGTLGFNGGAFNPGVLMTPDHKILLLAKAQVMPWFKAQGKCHTYHMTGNPVIFLLNSDTLNTKKATVISELGFPTDQPYALEDLRMFRWQGKMIVNHTYLLKDIEDAPVRSALSVLNYKEHQLQFCALPTLDFPLQALEKNWVYQENNDRLLLFYSVNPYRVLELHDAEKFKFRTIINQNLQNRLNDPGGFGTMVSFSTNPIDFDEKHWLVIIHQFKKKITGRWYVHWAVLIDKTSLLPVQITSKPIFTGAGARGRVPGYRYISSVLKVNDEVLFFAGEGDVYVTVTKKLVIELHSLFRTI